MKPARWFSVGAADGMERDPGTRAAEAALVHDDAKLLLVLCSPSNDLPAVVREIRATAGDVPLIGCTTGGEIALLGPRDTSLVVAAFGGEGFAVETAVATEASRDLRAAGARAARCVPAREDLPHKVLMMLSDGLAGDQQEVVRGAYSVLGAGCRS